MALQHLFKPSDELSTSTLHNLVMKLIHQRKKTCKTELNLLVPMPPACDACTTLPVATCQTLTHPTWSCSSLLTVFLRVLELGWVEKLWSLRMVFTDKSTAEVDEMHGKLWQKTSVLFHFRLQIIYFTWFEERMVATWTPHNGRQVLWVILKAALICMSVLYH